MKKRIKIHLIVLVFLLLLTANITAQNSTPHFGLQVGSSFSYMGPFGNIFTHNLAPAMNWDMSEKFSLQVGTIFSTARLSGSGMMPYTNHLSGEQLFNHEAATQLSSITLYAFGAYQLNPKLTITGGTWMEQTGFDFMRYTKGSVNTYNPQGMMLGLDYRVNENLRFGIEVSTTRGYNPYLPPFYQHNVFPGGLNRHPFSRFPQ